MEARLVTVQIAPGLREPDHWMYRLETEGGGILHMEGGHWLALFQMFAQARVRSVTALCSRRTDVSQEGVEDAATVALEYTNGVHACLHMGYLLTAAGPRNDTYMAVRGDLGAAAWDDVGSGKLVVSSAAPQWRGAPQRTFDMPPAPRAVYAEQWGFEYVSEFLKAVREGGQALFSIEDGHHFLQIFDAAYESSQRRPANRTVAEPEPARSYTRPGNSWPRISMKRNSPRGFLTLGQHARLFILDPEIHRFGADVM